MLVNGTNISVGTFKAIYQYGELIAYQNVKRHL